MLIYAKKLINLPIVESISSRRIGVISDIIVDYKNGIILGVKLKKSPWLGSEKVLMFQDVVEIYIDGVVTNSDKNIVDSDEVVRVKNILDQKIFFLGSRVITQNGKKLGFLEDFIFDSASSSLVTLVVKKMFSSERRLISSKRILNVLSGKIIIRDLTDKESALDRSKVLEPFPSV